MLDGSASSPGGQTDGTDTVRTILLTCVWGILAARRRSAPRVREMTAPCDVIDPISKCKVGPTTAAGWCSRRRQGGNGADCRRMDQLIKHHLHTSSSLSKVFGRFRRSQAARTLARSVCAGDKHNTCSVLSFRARLPKWGSTNSGKRNDRRLHGKTGPGDTRYSSYRRRGVQTRQLHCLKQVACLQMHLAALFEKPSQG